MPSYQDLENQDSKESRCEGTWIHVDPGPSGSGSVDEAASHPVGVAGQGNFHVGVVTFVAAVVELHDAAGLADLAQS